MVYISIIDNQIYNNDGDMCDYNNNLIFIEKYHYNGKKFVSYIDYIYNDNIDTIYLSGDCSGTLDTLCVPNIKELNIEIEGKYDEFIIKHRKTIKKITICHSMDFGYNSNDDDDTVNDTNIISVNQISFLYYLELDEIIFKCMVPEYLPKFIPIQTYIYTFNYPKVSNIYYTKYDNDLPKVANNVLNQIIEYSGEYIDLHITKN